MNKTAVVVGGTGLIGKALVKKLCADSRYREVKLLVRKPTAVVDSKVTVIELDFTNIEQLKQHVVGDELFCCIGTTIRKAGSQEKFEEVDYQIPKNLAFAAAKNNVHKFLMISSLGANSNSPNFYLRTKGKAEQALTAAGLNNYLVVRPSLLTGTREETRVGEKIGEAILSILKPVMLGPLKKYKPVSDVLLSNALVNIANSNFKNRVFDSPELFQWEEKHEG